MCVYVVCVCVCSSGLFTCSRIAPVSRSYLIVLCSCSSYCLSMHMFVGKWEYFYIDPQESKKALRSQTL